MHRQLNLQKHRPYPFVLPPTHGKAMETQIVLDKGKSQIIERTPLSVGYILLYLFHTITE
jgi:hypothetical protein